jgi:phage tail sheath gpL-like
MGSPSVSFAGTGISNNIRKPGIYFYQDVKNALQGLQPTNDSVCLIAQILSTGTVAAKVPTTVYTDADAGLFFGQGSVAHLMARAAILANPNVKLTIVGVSDNGTTKATGSFTVGSVPAAGGTLYCWIGDQMATISYTGATSANDVCQDIYDAFLPNSYLLPVTMSPSTNVLTLTAKNAGTCGNMVALSAADVNGNTWITIGAMAGGATDPDVGVYSSAGTVLASVVGGSYTIFVNGIPQTEASHDAATKISAMVDFVSGPMEQRPAITVMAGTELVDSAANTKTLCGTDLNDGRTTCAFISYASDDLAKSEYFKIAAAYAAVIASESDPTVPYDGLPLTSIAPPAVVDRLTRTQQEDYLNSGVTPLEVIAGEQTAIVRAITTYTTNSLSIPDITLLDINTYRTLDLVRFQVRSRLASRFQRGKINARIIKMVKTEIIDVLYLLQSLEIVQNIDTYKSGVIVEVDTSDPTRLDCKIPGPIVSGLHVISGNIVLQLG